jgi:hypothetical protein
MLFIVTSMPCLSPPAILDSKKMAQTTAKNKKIGFGSTISKPKADSNRKESIPSTDSLPQYYELANVNSSDAKDHTALSKKSLKKANITTKHTSKKSSSSSSNNNKSSAANQQPLPQYHELSGGGRINKGVSKKKQTNSYLGIISQHQKAADVKKR